MPCCFLHISLILFDYLLAPAPAPPGAGFFWLSSSESIFESFNQLIWTYHFHRYLSQNHYLDWSCPSFHKWSFSWLGLVVTKHPLLDNLAVLVFIASGAAVPLLNDPFSSLLKVKSFDVVARLASMFAILGYIIT